MEQHLLLEMQKQNSTYQPFFFSTRFWVEAVLETLGSPGLASQDEPGVVYYTVGEGRPVQKVAEGLLAFPW